MIQPMSKDLTPAKRKADARPAIIVHFEGHQTLIQDAQSVDIQFQTILAERKRIKQQLEASVAACESNRLKIEADTLELGRLAATGLRVLLAR